MRHALTAAKAEAVALFVAFAALSVYVIPEAALLMVIGAFLAGLFESRKLLVVAVMNVLAGALVHAQGRSIEVYWLFPLPSAGELAVSAGVFLAVMGFFYLYMVATVAMHRHLSVLLLFGGTLVLASRYFELSKFGRGFAHQLMLGVWCHGFYLLQIRRLCDIRLLDFLACQRPFFNLGAVPTPALLPQFITPTTPEQRRRSRRDAVGLLLVCALCAWGVNQLRARGHVIYGFDLEHYRDSSLLGRWLLILGAFGKQLLLTMLTLGPAVATCRMMGLRLASPIGNLLAARTFYHFVYATNRYYASIVVDLFVDPAYRALRRLPDALRLPASVLAGLTAAGVCFHFLRVVYFDAWHERPLPVWPRLVGASMYWGLLAAAVCLSFAWERKASREGESVARRALRVSVYIGLSAALRVFVVEFTSYMASPLERVRLLLLLVGL